MNILILTSIYPEPDSYGIPNDTKAVHYFAKEFADMGHNVLVYHLYSNPVSRFFKGLKKSSKIKESYLDGVRIIFGSIQLVVPHRFSGFKYQQHRAANRFIRYKQRHGNITPDIIIAHFPTTFAWFCNKIIGVQKSGCVMHGVDLRALEELEDLGNFKLKELIMTTFDVIAYRASTLKDRGCRLGITGNAASVIYSGLPDSLIHPLEEIKGKFENNNTVKMICAGHLNKQKRVDILIKGLSECQHNCTLKIVGDGSEKDELAALAKNLGIEKRVDFCGWLDRSEVFKEMIESDIFAMVSENETLGLVYLEAMAAGCITIGTKGEGIDGIIEDGENGFLVPPGDHKALARIIDKIAVLPKEEKKRLSLNGYFTVSQMTNKKMAEIYLRSFSDK